MFFGRVYNQWEADEKGYGTDWAEDMKSNMSGWVTGIIDGR